MIKRYHIDILWFPVLYVHYISDETTIHPLESSRQSGLVQGGSEIQKSGQQITSCQRVSKTLDHGS